MVASTTTTSETTSVDGLDLQHSNSSRSSSSRRNFISVNIKTKSYVRRLSFGKRTDPNSVHGTTIEHV